MTTHFSPGRDEEGLVGWIVQNCTGCQTSNVAVHVGSGGSGAARDVDRRARWGRRDNNLHLSCLCESGAPSESIYHLKRKNTSKWTTEGIADELLQLQH